MKKFVLVIILVALLYGAYYAIAPLFHTIEVQDELVDSARSSESYSVVDTTGHPASGTVRVLEMGEARTIRFEDFETINGPNLHLYLAKDLEAKEYIDLGPIRGTEGNINYTVPEDVDLSEYRYVMHWCVPFGVLFNYVELDLMR